MDQCQQKNEDWDCVDLCNFVNQVYDGENSSYFKEFSTKYRQNTDVTVSIISLNLNCLEYSIFIFS